MSSDEEVMSSDEEVSVISEQLVASPEPIAQAMYETELEDEYAEEESVNEVPVEPEEDSDEAPEADLLDELMDQKIELQDRVQELEEQYEEEKKATGMLGDLVHHLLNKNGDLADRLMIAGQKILRLEAEKEVIRNHLGHTIQGLEARVQDLQLDKRAITNCWRDTMTSQARTETQNKELEGEVRNKKVKIDKMTHAFKTAHERFQHRVIHFPREEYRSGHTINRDVVMTMAEEEREDALRRGC